MPDAYKEAITHALRQVAQGALPDANDRSTVAESLDQLRTTALGATLYRLARIARGQETATIDDVSHAVRAVLAVIFWSDNMDREQVEEFYCFDPLGSMFMRAKWRCVGMEDLMSIESTAVALALGAATIRQWMFTDVLEFVRDDRTGRLYALRSEVERIRAKISRVGVSERLPLKGWEREVIAEPDRELEETEATREASANHEQVWRSTRMAGSRSHDRYTMRDEDEELPDAGVSPAGRIGETIFRV